ncbi:MAG: hypothetical protein OXN17_08230 [Candidatus Poribacteria bacterium]|nr:hypothetical protein [Candidatus Poribacteria bacterium]MDE0505620.1 hypothetical protein [Candidatus Poribacteria bacterium]
MEGRKDGRLSESRISRIKGVRWVESKEEKKKAGKRGFCRE